MTDADIEVEQDAVIETEVTDVFGSKISRALVAIDWKLKENALKFIYKNSEKFLDMQNNKQQSFTIE